MITQLKSLILAMSLVDKHLTVEQAVVLSRLEEEYQVNLTIQQVLYIPVCGFRHRAQQYCGLFGFGSSVVDTCFVF